MSPVDIVILVILSLSTLIGVFRGFIREVLSLASWIVALYVAWLFAAQGAVHLEPYIGQPALRIAAAFAGIFVIMLIAASILSYLLYRLLYISGISGMDRSLGAVFGIARGVVLVAAVILAAVYMDFAAQPWWQGSKLVVYFTPVTDFLMEGHRASGVVALVDGEPTELAARSVVVASGGFEANKAWLRDLWGEPADRFVIRGSPFNMGGPLKALLERGALSVGNPKGAHAISVDARAPDFDGGIVTRIDSVPLSIMVNRAGRRFAVQTSHWLRCGAGGRFPHFRHRPWALRSATRR